MPERIPARVCLALPLSRRERFDLEPTGLTREATLRSVGLDSMMVLDVMLEVEDRLGVKLDDMSLPKDATLGDVANLISRNLEKSSAP